MTRRPGIRIGFVAVASFLLSTLLLTGCDSTGGESTPQSPQFTVANDLESRITSLSGEGTQRASAKASSSSGFSVQPVIRVDPPVVDGDTTVASNLSFNEEENGDRVFVGYKLRGTNFGGGIDVLDADDPSNLTASTSARSSNLDVQEVVDDPDAGAQYVAGAMLPKVADTSPSVIAKLSFSGNTIDVTDERLSANVAKSVVNAPSGDSRHDLYVVTDDSSLYRFDTSLGDEVQQTASGAERGFSSITAHQDRLIMLTKGGEIWRAGASPVTQPSSGPLSLDGSGINPIGIARVRTSSHATADSNFVFAALNAGGFRVLDADAATELYSQTGGGNYTSVSATGQNDYLFASRDNGRVEVYEFTGSPGSPSWTSSPIATINTRDYGSVPSDTQANQVLVVGNYLYVANSKGGLLVLTIADDNQAPDAADDSDQTTEDQSTTTDVLANDSDPDGSLVESTVQVQSSPSNGTVSVDGSTGAITYTPDTDFTGSDSYTYTVDDGDGATSDPATVSITVSATNAATAGCEGGIGGGIAFTNDGNLQTLASDGGGFSELLSTPSDEPVLALGTGVDLDDDGHVGVVFVQENPNGEEQTLRVIDQDDASARSFSLSATAKTSKTLLGVGSWEGSDPSAFYVAAVGNGDEIRRVSFDTGDEEPVADPENGVDAIIGIADIDGDGNNELVFSDGSQETRYVESGDGVTQSFTKVPNAGAGSNNNIGIGSCLADVDGDGSASVPITDGSNQILLVEGDGTTETIIGGSDDEQAAKTPLAWAEVDNDGETELVYLENNNSPAELKYVDDVGGTNTFNVLRDAAGSRIEASTSTGVVSAQ